MGKIAIYTCIIGAYDELQQPCIDSAEDFDFICFVAKGEKSCERIGVWEIRELDESVIGSSANRALLSRYPKMHPHLLLSDYEASLWIDGNISICGTSLFEILREKFASGVLYSGVPHPSRDCSYAEARKCRDMRYISNLKLLYIWAWLALHGIMRHQGLMENNLIFRRHCDPAIVRLNELWWNYVCNFCHRDQLSFMYCLKKCRIQIDYLLGAGLNSRNFKGLKYLKHKK